MKAETWVGDSISCDVRERRPSDSPAFSNIDVVELKLQKGFVINHERWNNRKFDIDYTTFRLFWTSPGDKSYYGSKLLTYRFKLDRNMKGVSLLSSPSDLEYRLSPIPDHDIIESCDAFKNMWYAILEKDLLGYEVDFIYLYDSEIIFSKKNMRHLIHIHE